MCWRREVTEKVEKPTPELAIICASGAYRDIPSQFMIGRIGPKNNIFKDGIFKKSPANKRLIPHRSNRILGTHSLPKAVELI